MSTQLGFPAFKPKQVLTVQIETELLKRIKLEAKRRKLTLRQIVEYGMSKFLEESLQA